MIFNPFLQSRFTFWHGIGHTPRSSDLFKEYLSKLLLETGSRGIRPVSFFYTYPIPIFILSILIFQHIFFILCFY